MTESHAQIAETSDHDHAVADQPSPAITLLQEVGLNVGDLSAQPTVRIDNYRVTIVISTDRPNSAEFIAALDALQVRGCIVDQDPENMLSRTQITINAPLNLLPAEEVNFLARKTGEALTAGIIGESHRLRQPAKDPVVGC